MAVWRRRSWRPSLAGTFRDLIAVASGIHSGGALLNFRALDHRPLAFQFLLKFRRRFFTQPLYQLRGLISLPRFSLFFAARTCMKDQRAQKNIWVLANWAKAVDLDVYLFHISLCVSNVLESHTTVPVTPHIPPRCELALAFSLRA